MAFGRLVISTYLLIAITLKVKSDTAPSPENLVDEYYTTIVETQGDYLPQDEKDAQAIVDSDRSEKVIAGILPYRDKQRRFKINERIATKIKPVDTFKDGRRWESIRYWVSDTYYPQHIEYGNSTRTFWDLCFGLIEDESVVMGAYLANFLSREDETWVVIGMVLIKDMERMIKLYDSNHWYTIKNLRKSQKHPFENMLRVWVRHNREPIENDDPNHDNVVKDANTLKSEHDSGDWHEKKRDQLELILMKKSIKYARAVIAEFEKIMGGKLIEDIINDSIKTCKLNHDLADAYSSLARYIKNKYKYIAGIFVKYCDGSDYWGAWIMSIAVLHPNEWPKVDDAFRNDNKGQSLRDFILQKLTSNKIMAEMIAVVVDPTFKPTEFSPTPAEADEGKEKPPTNPPSPVPQGIPGPQH